MTRSFLKKGEIYRISTTEIHDHSSPLDDFVCHVIGFTLFEVLRHIAVLVLVFRHPAFGEVIRDTAKGANDSSPILTQPLRLCSRYPRRDILDCKSGQLCNKTQRKRKESS